MIEQTEAWATSKSLVRHVAAALYYHDHGQRQASADGAPAIFTEATAASMRYAGLLTLGM